jgi:FAD/FMN-containing dehydrogenase
MNLREAVALAVLPALINSDGGGIVCEDVAIAFSYADEFCARIDRDNDVPSETLQIIP